jgi:hypothetical protein
MKLLKTFVLAAGVCALPGLPVLSTAQAQAFPTKPISLVIPPAGRPHRRWRAPSRRDQGNLGHP